MKILFDQNIPRTLRKSLSGHFVQTAWEMQWSTLKNGYLLEVAELHGFDLLITADRRLRYQQNLSKRKSRLWSYLPTIGSPSRESS